MILCSDSYATHFMIDVDGRLVNGGPDGCILHTDDEHQQIAMGCGYCKDYHCKNAT